MSWYCGSAVMRPFPIIQRATSRTSSTLGKNAGRNRGIFMISITAGGNSHLSTITGLKALGALFTSATALSYAL